MWADSIQHSLYGRRLGVDANNYIVGTAGIREGLESASVDGTTIAANGTTILNNATAASTFNLPPPSVALQGVEKTVIDLSTGTNNQTLKLATGNFLTSLSSTYTTITFASTVGAIGGRGNVYLQYISTAFVALIGSTGATGSGSTAAAFS